MRICILGSAAGGGLPQWNCRCENCQAVRTGSQDVQPRTQSSVAIRSQNLAWFLLNASADIRQQIVRCPEFDPPPLCQRGTNIAGCVLTDAEIDHTSGLLQLREGCTLGIFSTPIVHRWLTQYFPVRTVLDHFAHRPWTEIPLDHCFELPLANGDPSGLIIQAFEVGRDVPRFVPENTSDAIGSVIGLHVQDTATGGVLVYAPGAALISESLTRVAEEADCILFDGTFWTDDEPIRAGITQRTARQMGHIPVSGPDGSLNWLANLSARHRAYVHINNTNPVLHNRSPERRHVIQQGVQIGMDGDVFDV